MAKNRTLRAAMVGLSSGHAGSIGPERPRFIRTFRHLDGVETVAYCEWRDTSFLDDAKKHDPDANRYDSLDDLIAREDFDVACVVLAPADVPDACLKLAEAGKHFLVDKQFAIESKDLIPAVKAVRRNKVTTFIGYPWRYQPAALELRQLIEDGILGRPIDIESRQFSVQVGGEFGRDPGLVQFRKETEGGGVLHYIGCHHLDLMRAIMGCEVKSVTAMMGRPLGHIEEPLEDIAILALEYENGGYGSLHHGYTKPLGHVPLGYDSAFMFRGTEGWAEWTPVGGNRLKVTSASPRWRAAPEQTFTYEFEETPYENRVTQQSAGHFLPPNPDLMGGRRYHKFIQAFIEDIHAGKPGALNMDDALYVLQSIDAAYESGRTGKRVEVKYGV